MSVNGQTCQMLKTQVFTSIIIYYQYFPCHTHIYSKIILYVFQCHSEAGEIVPNTLDELVDYLDIEGAVDGSELFGDENHTFIDGQFKDYTTFGSEDRWPI